MNLQLDQFINLRNKIVVATSLALISPSLFAAGTGVPVFTPPAGANTSDFLGMITAYSGAIIAFLALLFTVWVLVVVVKNMVATYSKIESKEATWTQFGSQVVTGVMLILLSIWLITMFASVFTAPATP